MSAGLGKRGRTEAMGRRPSSPQFPPIFVFALSQFWGLDYLGALNSLRAVSYTHLTLPTNREV